MRIDTSALLDELLHRVLLLLYATIVATVIIVAGAWGERPITSASEVPWWTVLTALAVVVVTWAPLSSRLDRSVHELVYGQHDDAYRVVERLHHELHADRHLDELLRVLAATLAQTLALPYVAIEAGRPDSTASHRSELMATAVYGTLPSGSDPVIIPLRYRDDILGELRVGPRRRGGALSAADLRLLDGLARNVAVTVQTAGLSDAVRSSRAQLVTAREEERRRIRRDLHDGLGPTLASLRFQLAAARRTLRDEPERAEHLLAELQEDLAGATADVRRLVHDLRPPMLDEFGLAGALHNLGPIAEAMTRTVEVPDPSPPMPAAVEVALYRIAAEALTNIARHAGATACRVQLTVAPVGTVSGEVTLTVTDDGRGLPRDYAAGVGHVSMRERVAELGGSIRIASPPAGGTVVTATLPLP